MKKNYNQYTENLFDSAVNLNKMEQNKIDNKKTNNFQ